VPNIKSAEKRVLVNKKKHDENQMIRTRVKNAVKTINQAIDTNNIEEAEALLPKTAAIIDKAVSKGIFHKNTAANKKSAIAKRIDAIKSGKLVIQIKKDNKTIAAEKAKAAKDAREAVRAENARKAAERAAEKEAEKKAAEQAAKDAKKAAKKEKPEKAKAVKEDKPAEEKKPAKKPAAKKKTEDGETAE
jgi:small subunit ribosomal protein S20